jgi:hypothetical protein
VKPIYDNDIRPHSLFRIQKELVERVPEDVVRNVRVVSDVDERRVLVRPLYVS